MKLFKLEVVKNCPVSNGSKGVMVMSPALIATIAGAVRDKIEWIAYLNGTRSADGFEVKVERFTIPQQYRSGVEAEIVGAVELADDVVGVIHSHHHMGAFFSGTDTGELNPRFPSSIVVAIANNSLGFNYKAEGKVVLPCGAIGKVDFNLSVDGVERFTEQPVRASHEGLATGLGDCQHVTQDATTDPFEVVNRAACGMFTAAVPKPLAFGVEGGDGFIATVEKCTETRVYTGGNNNGRGLPPGKYSGGVAGQRQSGLGYINNYDRYQPGEQTVIGFRTTSYNAENTDHLTKRERKRRNRAEKWAAKRGGLERITDDSGPYDFADGKTGEYMFGDCVCGKKQVMLKKHRGFGEWLCVTCYDDADIVCSEVDAESGSTAVHDATIILDDDQWEDAVATANSVGELQSALADMVGN